MDTEALASKIKLLLMDVDGVLTDGGLYIVPGPDGKMAERTFDKPTQFLLRVPMKAGQVKQILTESPAGGKYAPLQGIEVISPIGLPDIHLDQSTGINQAVPATSSRPRTNWSPLRSLGRCRPFSTVRHSKSVEGRSSW